MAEPKAQELKDILEILNRHDKYVKFEDVSRFFQELTSYVKRQRPELETFLDGKVTELRKKIKDSADSAYEEIFNAVRDIEDRMNETRKSEKLRTQEDMDRFTTDITDRFTHLAELVREMPRIEDIRAEILAAEARAQDDVPDPETPESIRDALEQLRGDDRLDKSAIKGLDELEAAIGKGGGNFYGSSRGVDLSLDGTNKGLTQYLNLIAGPGTTLSYNRVGERADVTISVTGGGGLSVLAATGTVDDSNTTFTFASAPTLVVVNGTSYRNGHGATITGTTAVLDFPVGTGGDIYGLG